MTDLPEIGDRLRRNDTGEDVEVVGLEGMTGTGGGLFVLVVPVGADRTRARRGELLPLADVEPLR